MGFAAVFPGQGSQSVGMLAELADAYPTVGSTFAEASQALGYDLWRVCREGPEEKLNSTECTQPAMLAAGVAVFRVWREQGGAAPEIMAGHSLGEYSALVCANGVAFPDAVALVAARGRYMQEAVPSGQGAVAAVIGLGDDDVEAACRAAARGEGGVPRELQRAGAGGARRSHGSGDARSRPRAGGRRPAGDPASAQRPRPFSAHGAGRRTLPVATRRGRVLDPGSPGGGEHRHRAAPRSGLDTRPPRPPSSTPRCPGPRPSSVSPARVSTRSSSRVPAGCWPDSTAESTAA